MHKHSIDPWLQCDIVIVHVYFSKATKINSERSGDSSLCIHLHLSWPPPLRWVSIHSEFTVAATVIPMGGASMDPVIFASLIRGW